MLENEQARDAHAGRSDNAFQADWRALFSREQSKQGSGNLAELRRQEAKVTTDTLPDLRLFFGSDNSAKKKLFDSDDLTKSNSNTTEMRKHLDVFQNLDQERKNVESATPGTLFLLKSGNSETLMTKQQFLQHIQQQQKEEVDKAARAAEKIDPAVIQFGINALEKKLQDLYFRDADLAKKVEEQVEQLKSLIELKQLVIDTDRETKSADHVKAVTGLVAEGKYDQAQNYMKDIAGKDPALTDSQVSKDLSAFIESERKHAESDKLPKDSPIALLSLAQQKNFEGNTKEAEELFKKAIEQAKNLDPENVRNKIAETAKVAKEMYKTPFCYDALARLDGWTRIAESETTVNFEYAKFLLSHGRNAEAKEPLFAILKGNPEFVKETPQFKELMSAAQHNGKQGNIDFVVHIKEFEEAAQCKDRQGALRALAAAKEGAKNIDKEVAQANKKLVEEELRIEKNPDQRAQLELQRNFYDYLLHATAHITKAQAMYEQHMGNYETAEKIYHHIAKIDPEFAARDKEKEEIEQHLKECNESKDWLGKLATNAVSILAGVAGGFLVGGPLGAAAAIAAGIAGYGTTQIFLGKELNRDTIIEGGLNGLGGAFGHLVRGQLIKVGGRLVTAEIAEMRAVNAVGKVVLNAGTAAATASVCRLAELKDCHSMEEFLSNYSRGIAKDAALGAVFGWVPLEWAGSKLLNKLSKGKFPVLSEDHALLTRAFDVGSPGVNFVVGLFESADNDFAEFRYQEELRKQGHFPDKHLPPVYFNQPETMKPRTISKR